ncbi:MAG: flavin-dependent oxidoreductase, F420-dependent methylene-tetrahydromethanopterin reductase [Ilumatobacteraceae bacterium]|nr:flavin-dependent oxidoreductase, F420-dependent methylene-tetrahydromethanopterin reductase [Ilumatobacteraceae bacterium]
MPAMSVALPPTPTTPALAVLAEQLGYDRVWLYDTPALQLDVWMHLALCARETNRIGLGPAVLIPSLRHPLVTAAAIATLEQLAGGRTAYAIGSGFTGRRALGQKPMRWADVVDYVRQVQALLRGDEVEIDGALVGMIHGDGQAPARPIDVPWMIGASGPKGFAAARELGAGVFTTVPAPGFDDSALLWFGTVLADGEDPDGTRVLEAAGPGGAVAYHALYEQHSAALDGLPGAAAWVAAIEEVPVERRHLEIHRGHLTELNDIDRLVMSGSLAVSITRSGTASALRDLVERAAAAGTTDFVFQPAGPDPARELEAFIAAVRG